MDCRVKPGNDEENCALRLTAPLVTTGLDPVVHAAFERAQSCQKYFDTGGQRGLPGQARQ